MAASQEPEIIQFCSDFTQNPAFKLPTAPPPGHVVTGGASAKHKPAGGDPKHAAHQPHRILALHGLQQRVPGSDAFAKYAAAFLTGRAPVYARPVPVSPAPAPPPGRRGGAAPSVPARAATTPCGSVFPGSESRFPASCARHGPRLATWNEVAGESDDNRREAQGGRREASLKAAWNQGTIAGTRTDSEAGYGRSVC
jgi:hypothetical protein